MNRAEAPGASFEENELLLGGKIIPPIRGFSDLFVHQRSVSRMVGKELKNVLDLLVRGHADIIVDSCLLCKENMRRRFAPGVGL